MCKVSVITPIYNSDKYLRQCLNSLICQTLKDIEFICVNDGSTDSSLQILQEFALRDKRIRIIDKPNSGYGHSMNVGIAAAHGEFIGIVESDDFVEPEMFEELYQIAKKYKAQAVKSNYWEYREEAGDKYRNFMECCPKTEVFSAIDIPSLFCGEIYLWTGIYELNFLREKEIVFNETPGASYQDVSFTFKILALAKRMKTIDKAFYHYRLDNENSSVHSKEKVYCICDEFEEIEKFIAKHNEEWEKLKYIIPNMLYKRYMGTYNRIAKQYKVEFLERMYADLMAYERRGLINEQCWQLSDWEGYCRLKKTFLNSITIEQIGDILLRSFIKKVNSIDKKIYIYGAGKVGRAVAKRFIEWGKRPNAFVVTEHRDGQDIVDDIKVYQLDDLMDKDSDCIFFTAVKDDDQLVVLENLWSKGYKDTIIMSELLRKALNII